MAAVDVAVTPATGALRERRSRFFAGMSIAAALTVFVGFAPSFYLKPIFGLGRPLLPIVALHGGLFSAWVLLMVAQPALVARGRIDLHRPLGIAGAVLAVAMILVASAADIGGDPGWIAWFAVHPTPAATAIRYLAGNTGALVQFGALVAAAVYWRARPQAHKRLMLLATVAILPAALARLLAGVGFATGLDPPVLAALTWLSMHGVLSLTTLPFFGALVIHDLRTLARVHAATLCGGALVYLLGAFAMLALRHTDALRALVAAAH